MVERVVLLLAFLFSVSAFASPELEILYASPTSRATESVAGHLLLRVSDNQPDQEDRVIAFGANATGDGKLTQLRKGIFGGYGSIFVERTLSEAVAEYNEYQDRDLWRYRLKLSAADVERVLAKLEKTRRGKPLGYKFFTQNCATLLVQQIAEAIGDSRITSVPSFLKSPQAMLARLIELGYAEEVAPSFWSASRRQKLAKTRRQMARDGLRSEQRFAPLLAKTDGASTVERKNAYGELAGLAQDESSCARIYWFLLFSRDVEQERLKSDVAEQIRMLAVLDGYSDQLERCRGLENFGEAVDARMARQELRLRTFGSAHTGILPIAVGAGFVAYQKSGARGTSYELLLSGAYFSEKLGSRSRLKFALGGELELLPVSVSLSQNGLEQLQATLLGVRPMGERFGIGLRLLDIDWNRRGEESRLLIDWVRSDFLVKLLGSDGFRSFVLFSLGLAVDRSGLSLPAALEAQYSVDRAQKNVLLLKIEARSERRAKAGARVKRSLGSALGSDWILYFESSVEKIESYKEFKVLVGAEARSW